MNQPAEKQLSSNGSLRLYPVLLVGIPLLVLVAVAVLNFRVDPFRLFTANPPALYSEYPALHPNLRLHKAYQVNRQKPDVIVLGTSKAIQGIPLDHDYFAHRRVYNFAAPLASMREIYHQLLHAQANQPLQEVIFVVDFLSFNVLARVDGPASGYVEQRLKRPGGQSRYWPDYLSAMLSLDALDASLQVLDKGSNTGHRVLNGRGGREDNEIAGRLTDGGHRSNSGKIESFFINAVLLAAPHRRFSLSNDIDDSMRWFKLFVEEVHSRGIKTTLVIGPSHTRYWELLNQAGLWQEFEQWKRKLVEINESLAKASEKRPLALWDFTLPSKITSEEFPKAGDSDTRMEFYYESIHFNQHTGALLLDRISERENSQLVPEFGIKLDYATLPDVEARLRTAMQYYRAANPALLDELASALPKQRLTVSDGGF